MRYLKDSIIVSLKQAIEASHLLEKFLWICLGTLGSAYFGYLLASQMNSWDKNSILVSQWQKSIDDIEFPAMTFCAQTSTKYAIAERIGNSLDRDSSFAKEKLLPVRNELIKLYVKSEWDDGEKVYDANCVNERRWSRWSYYKTENEIERYCTVSSITISSPSQKCLTYINVSSQRSQLLFEYAKSNDMTYANIYEDLVTELFQTWNIPKAVTDFYHKRIDGIKEVSNTTITLASDDEWKYFHAVRLILGLDWFPEKLGSFFVNWLLHAFSRYGGKEKWENRMLLSDQFDSAFTIPGMNISIMNFANLHTMNDFRQLLVLEEVANRLKGNEYADAKSYLANFPSSFYKCFNQEKSYFEQMNSDEKEAYMLKSPCIEKRHPNICKEYCQWSNESQWSNFFSEEEFMSLMKYALPQAMIPKEQENSEYKMAAKIVGKENLRKEPKFASVPLTILCKYQENVEWEGRDIGMNTKFCDNFFEVPSDVGLCISGSINTAEIFKTDLFTNDLISKKVKGGTYSSSATFFLNTNSNFRPQLFERGLYGRFDRKTIQMQIHPTTELAQILHDPRQDHSTRSFTLKRGHEYTFKLSIDGRTVTENFQELPIDQRKCKLPNEVDDNSWFKYYSKRHCKYKCRTILAYNACGCIPWDIFHVGNYTECDVFGRTCFMNVLENITHTNGLCEDCYDDCQYIRYKMIDVTEKKLSHYVTFSSSKGTCMGMKALCHYLNDKNHTLDDKYSPKAYAQAYKEKFHGMIIVNVVFPSFEVDLTIMDARYSLIDKVTSLGGSFGLFTQFTGCSIIAVIHLTILTIKRIYIVLKDLKTKFSNQE